MARSRGLDLAAIGPEPTGVGVINPGTRRAGIIVFRCFVVLSVALLVVYVAQLRSLLQHGFAALHNWAGPHADKLTGGHHAGKPFHAGPVPWKAVPSNPLIVVAAGLLVLIGAALLTKKTRDDVTETRWVRIVLIVAVSVIGAALLILLLGKWEPARPVVAIALRAIAQAAGSVAQFLGRVGL